MCWATGLGLLDAEAGQEASFLVYVVDTDKDIQGANAELSIEQHGPAVLSFVWEEVDNGIFNYSYVPRMQGDYLFIIKQNGTKIKHGAWRLHANHTRVTPAHTIFILANTSLAGEAFNVTVQAADKFDNFICEWHDVTSSYALLRQMCEKHLAKYVREKKVKRWKSDEYNGSFNEYSSGP